VKKGFSAMVFQINSFEEITKQLKKHGQDHLLRFYTHLTPSQQTELLGEIQALDFDLINRLIPEYVTAQPRFKLPEEITAPPVYPMEAEGPLREKYEAARQIGRQYIAENKAAVFTVAGGMGTRLNYDGPKGNVPATVICQKPLFRVFAESILATQNRYGGKVPWYIMTSPPNHEQTVRSFQENDYFGLNPADVILFPQGTMVCFDKKGKILLSEKGRLSTSPDGHGGSLRALFTGGAIADMEKRGVEQISYFQVDNPLVYVVDPLFIGLHVLDGAEMSSKAVIKTGPLEKVGNFVLVDGKVTVIEYSDLPDELAHKKNKDGKLMIEYGSIAIHIISRDFVKRINEHGFSLPWHRAVKKVPFINEQGLRVEPAQPNAVKLETFVFDALPLAKKSIILEIDRKEQFAPIKNATGVDSLESSRQLQLERAAKWLTLAGVEVPCHPDGTIDVQVEISPLFALDADELTQKRDQIPKLTAGGKFYIE